MEEEMSGRLGDINHPSAPERLAIVESFDRGKLVGMFLYELPDSPEHSRLGGGAHTCP